MKTYYIKDLQKNQIFENETFAVFDKKKADDKNGRPYYNLILGDKTGQLSAKIWYDQLQNCDTSAIKQGGLVKISAKVDEYKGVAQLNILTLEGVDETNLEEFIESSQFDADEMYDELTEEVKSIGLKELRKILLEIIQDKDIQRRLKYWPAANTIHHNFRSGLLQHLLEMYAIAKGLERFYPDVNFDILKAGILLHDIGKIYELDGTNIAIPYTKVGSLLGHIYMGSELFQKFAINRLPEDIYLHVLHLILSHHGKYEFGSPVLPATTEALMLTYIDDLSAKPRTADSVKKSLASDEEFSKRILWLENTKIWNFKTPEDSTNSDTDVDDTTASSDKIGLI